VRESCELLNSRARFDFQAVHGTDGAKCTIAARVCRLYKRLSAAVIHVSSAKSIKANNQSYGDKTRPALLASAIVHFAPFVPWTPRKMQERCARSVQSGVQPVPTGCFSWCLPGSCIYLYVSGAMLHNVQHGTAPNW